jgi:hypothetical protein
MIIYPALLPPIQENRLSRLRMAPGTRGGNLTSREQAGNIFAADCPRSSAGKATRDETRQRETDDDLTHQLSSSASIESLADWLAGVGCDGGGGGLQSAWSRVDTIERAPKMNRVPDRGVIFDGESIHPSIHHALHSCTSETMRSSLVVGWAD